jgi:Domain of unknown function (DUF4349)
MSLRRMIVLALGLFAALFLVRLLVPQRMPMDWEQVSALSQQSVEQGRKNYASSAAKAAVGGVAVPAVSSEQQKYEKIATLSQATNDFDDDQRRIATLVSSQNSIVQVERASGLSGRRSLSLAIGVPPDKFDAFIATAKTIGRSLQIDITKNDKTNEYLQLKAKRIALEKSRAALETMSLAGASVDERLKVQGRAIEIEAQLQNLGVSLGEFDTQNELCTVRLSLLERQSTASPSFGRRLIDTFEWTAKWYALAAIGIAVATLAAWLLASLIGYVRRLIMV